MDAIWQRFNWLNDPDDINLTIFYDEVDRGRLLTSIATTLKRSALCICAPVVIGIAGLQMSRFASGVSWTHTSSSCATPALIQMYIFYFSLDPALVAGPDHTETFFDDKLSRKGFLASRFDHIRIIARRIRIAAASHGDHRPSRYRVRSSRMRRHVGRSIPPALSDARRFNPRGSIARRSSAPGRVPGGRSPWAAKAS